MTGRGEGEPARTGMDIEPVITCIDCGGRAHLLTTWDPEDPPMAGDLATYRCEDCNDRWDLFLTEDDTP